MSGRSKAFWGISAVYAVYLTGCGGGSHSDDARSAGGESGQSLAGISSGGRPRDGGTASGGRAGPTSHAEQGGATDGAGGLAGGSTELPFTEGGVGAATDDPRPPHTGGLGGESTSAGGTGGQQNLSQSGEGGLGTIDDPVSTGGRVPVPATAGAGGEDYDSLAPPPGLLATHKVDLLFVVDNSASMQDKQALLAQAVPEMLGELVNPPCVDETGNVVAQPVSPSDTCASGTRRIPPVSDMHVGVITSSLGGHGNSSFCTGAEQNDGARLVPTVRQLGVPDSGAGFVVWDTEPSSAAGAGSIESQAELGDAVSTMITGAGENGCGYEAQLEAWYRFLVDPEPPAAVVQNASGQTERQGIDDVILGQRTAFLRPDSALVIVLLSDENDCSIVDSGYGWLATQNKIYRGTSVCATDPNDPCCTYCGYTEAPPGCPALAEDPGCQSGQDNATNVRCWDQKRRFGIDFLYPTARYVAALRDGVVCPDSTWGDGDCACRAAHSTGQSCDPGTPVTNPIYQDLSGGGAPVRDRSLVFLVSVVGVPWQDLATDDSLSDPDVLRYRVGSEVDWALVLGDPATNTPPGDALMVSSTTPRTGAPHPLLGVAPAAPDSGYLSNPINGHEWEPVNQEDLEYACIFPLAPILGEPRDCNAINMQTCDCFDPTADLSTVNRRKKPLCQNEAGEYTSVQTYAKAYPSPRELEVTRALGEAGFPASICPKILDQASPYYGYKPALSTLVTRLVRVIE